LGPTGLGQPISSTADLIYKHEPHFSHLLNAFLPEKRQNVGLRNGKAGKSEGKNRQLACQAMIIVCGMGSHMSTGSKVALVNRSFRWIYGWNGVVTRLLINIGLGC